MNRVEKGIKHFLKHYKGELTFYDLYNYVEKELHYKVVWFNSTYANNFLPNIAPKVWEQLEPDEKGIALYANNGAAKLVFLKKDMSDIEKITTILHEMGHIILGHLEESITPLEVFETDADIFAHVVYHTLNTRSERKAKKLKIITCVLSAITATTALLIWGYVV